MPSTVILGSARTPIGKLGGALASLDAPTLGGIAMAGALERAEVEPAQIEHIVMGTVLQAKIQNDLSALDLLEDGLFRLLGVRAPSRRKELTR